MRRLVLFTAFALAACSSKSEEPAAPAPSSCTPEGLCGHCGSCLDECLCGGGTEARCNAECHAPVADAGESDSGAVASPFVATLVADAFDIEPGEEFVRCQRFANPFGQDVAVQKVETFMTSGSHHLFVFVGDNPADNEDGELEACSGLTFGPNLHLSQRSHDVTRFPPGVGRAFAGKQGVRLQIHYLNSSEDVVHTEVSATISATMPDQVPILAAGVFINTFGIGVAPLSKGVAKNSCGVPKDIELFEATSHMHHHGVHFTARSSDGQLLYDTQQWAEPPAWTFEPPRHIPAGSTIDIRCDYQNDTPYSLTFGESADTNEMCIFTGAYYPAVAGEQIACIF
jgi:hypothetical protein